METFKILDRTFEIDIDDDENGKSVDPIYGKAKYAEPGFEINYIILKNMDQLEESSAKVELDKTRMIKEYDIGYWQDSKASDKWRIFVRRRDKLVAYIVNNNVGNPLGYDVSKLKEHKYIIVANLRDLISGYQKVETEEE